MRAVQLPQHAKRETGNAARTERQPVREIVGVQSDRDVPVALLIENGLQAADALKGWPRRRRDEAISGEAIEFRADRIGVDIGVHHCSSHPARRGATVKFKNYNNNFLTRIN